MSANTDQSRADQHEQSSIEESMQLGIAASESGDQATAYSIFCRVAEQRPDMFEVWVWLGWTSPTLDDSEAAFKRAYELEPSNEEASLGLRWVISQREAAGQSPAQTLPAAAAAAANAPQSAHAPATESLAETLERGIAAAQAGNKMGAYNIFQEVVSEYPGAPEAWVWLGGATPSLDEAELAFKRALELDPSNEEAGLGLRWVTLRRRVSSQASLGEAALGQGAGPFVGVSAPMPGPEQAADDSQKTGMLSFFGKLFRKKSA